MFIDLLARRVKSFIDPNIVLTQQRCPHPRELQHALVANKLHELLRLLRLGDKRVPEPPQRMTGVTTKGAC